MEQQNFIKNWIEIYYSKREKGLKKARVISLLVFSIVLFLFILQVVSVKQLIDTSEAPMDSNILIGTIKALIFQFIIVLGVFTNFFALRFHNRYAIRFAEVGILISFSAWLGHFIWTQQVISEIRQFTDICTPETLLHTPYFPALILTISFPAWFLYKVIFIIAVTWKTVRK